MSDRENLQERAYVFLRDAIVSGELEDGSQHSIYQLAEQLEMSRTPVRDAVIQLAEAGFVTVQRNRGFRVHGPTVERLRDIFELRLLLEVPATFYAAASGGDELPEKLRTATSGMTTALAEGDILGYLLHDRAFHEHIASAVGNRRLSSTLEGLREVVRDPGASSSFGVRDPGTVIEEHEAIARAIAQGDSRRSAEAMREHLVLTGTVLMDRLAQSRGESADPDWSTRLAGAFAHQGV
ncbi:GntR family transcriptional regulator [Actinospica sp. MGRD01-02]|uniref:GntR family transcriptional regulator n=1 Tax=Actinospica acidithermotolerans TaxID=2828514 RepID=A0A941E8W7_9ACTN|nr:GntR family transcriptional regulator [Actinospica acidithermotolerans]MBR7825685.1 GntR family transcriptional regulator [Actinospica acidithermotolerans]